MSDVRHAGMPTLKVATYLDIAWRDASAHAAADAVNEAAGKSVHHWPTVIRNYSEVEMDDRGDSTLHVCCGTSGKLTLPSRGYVMVQLQE